MQDLRFALRAFRRTPGTSSLVVTTLAVAIAAATIIASTIDMVWRFIPTERTDGLVFVASTDPRPEQSQSGVAGGLARTGVSIPDLVDWTERTSSFQELAGVTFQSAIMTGADAPSRISTARATRQPSACLGHHAAARPRVRSGRCGTRRPARRAVEPRLLAAPVLRRQGCRGPIDDDRRPAAHDRGSHARTDRPGDVQGDRRHGAPRARSRARAARRSPAVRHRRAEAGRRPRAGGSRPRACGTPAPERLPAHQRQERRRRASDDRDARRQHRRGPAAALVDCLHGGVHRLRERREHHPRAGGDAAPRARRPRGHGRRAMAPDPPVHGRKPRHRVIRRRRRAVPGLVGTRGDSVRERGHRRFQRHGAERPRARRQPGADPSGAPRIRALAGDTHVAARHGRAAPGHSRRRDAPRPMAARIARRAAGGARARADDAGRVHRTRHVAAALHGQRIRLGAGVDVPDEPDRSRLIPTERPRSASMRPRSSVSGRCPAWPVLPPPIAFR